MIYCENCYRVYKTNSSLNRHKKSCKLVVDEYYEKEYDIKICEYCGKKYKDEIKYKMHKEMYPLCRIGYKECDICGYRMRSYKEKEKHKSECKERIDIKEYRGKVYLDFN